MLSDFGLVLIMLITGTYIIARITSMSAASSNKKIQELREEARKRSINMLYGRGEGNDK